LLATSPLAAAKDQKPVVKAKVNKKEILIGDHLRYAVVAEFPKGLQVAFPELEDKLGSFDILSRSKKVGRPVFSGKERLELHMVVSAYERGEHVIPAFPALYIDQEGKTNFAVSESIKVTVKGVLKGRITPQLKDLKKQERLADPFLFLRRLFLVMLGVGGYFLYRFRERIFGQRLQAVIAKLEPALPPHEEAINRLNDVVKNDVLGKSGIKEYYSIINEIMRHYLHRAFGLTTLEKTSDEIIAQLPKVAWPQGVPGQITDFLQESDLVKFAKMIPSKNEISGFLSTAYDIVEQTKPKQSVEEPQS
jgi:hypothetical protein